MLAADEEGPRLVGLEGPPIELLDEAVWIEDIDLSDFFLFIVGRPVVSELYADAISKGWSFVAFTVTVQSGASEEDGGEGGAVCEAIGTPILVLARDGSVAFFVSMDGTSEADWLDILAFRLAVD